MNTLSATYTTQTEDCARLIAQGMDPVIAERVIAFVADQNDYDLERNAAEATPWTRSKAYRVDVQPSNVKFVRLLAVDDYDGRGGQTFVYMFVEKATGTILKSAGYKAPAKGARGTFTTDEGLAAAIAGHRASRGYGSWLYAR